MQLLQVVSPGLKRMAKEEGQAGRKKVTQYTRYGTVLISAVQGLALAKYVTSMVSPQGIPVVSVPGGIFLFTATITVVTGTILIMWIGERITEKGVGNGISLIIFSGIVSGIPGTLYRFFGMLTGGSLNIAMAIVIALVLAAILVFIVFMERGQRRIPIHYAKRQVGRKMMGGQSTHLPLRVNTAGVIPPIFASSLLMFPTMILPQFAETSETARNILNLFMPGGMVYTVLFVALIVFFCYFYTAIIFDPKDIAENLKRQGGFIPGIRPGGKTQEYIDKVLTRITLWGAIYISFICVAPQFLLSRYNIYLGGTSLLIVVGVAMDFMGQVESHLISHQYEGLLGKARIKGRQG
jgi:preprotein translocase subunit SecY